MPDLTPFNSPGVYVRESTWGVIPASLVGHSSVFMLLSIPNANLTVPRNTPIFVDSFDSYRNLVGGAILPSDLMVQSFFDQRSGVGLNLVFVRTNARVSLVVPSATPSTNYDVTIGTVLYRHTTPASGATVGSILTALANLINTPSSGARLFNNVLTSNTALTVTTSANITLNNPFVAPTLPDIHDVRVTLNSAFDADLQKGYIIAPEFFRQFTVVADLTQLQNAMEAFASDPSFNWIAIIDTSLATGTATSIPDFVDRVRTERGLMSSPRGHSCLYAPYVLYSNSATPVATAIPPSAVVAGTAVRVQREFGLRQPPASINFPLRGVTTLSMNITRQVQEVLNPLGINCIRTFRNQGVCIYGARTLSTNRFYTFYLVRLILNILAATLEDAYEGLVLTSVDGLGTTFSNVVGTGKAVCEQLRRAGALYGNSPDQAYQVICNATNNPGIDLDAGKLAVEVIVVPTATIEVIGITLSRAAIGSPLVETVTGVQSTATSTSAPTVTPRS
jgi:uncharacterized protein